MRGAEKRWRGRVERGRKVLEVKWKGIRVCLQGEVRVRRQWMAIRECEQEAIEIGKDGCKLMSEVKKMGG